MGLKNLAVTVCLLKLGPPRQWKPIRRQNWNNRFQHFQIQPIKCPVQNNEISTCSLTGDAYATKVSVNDQLKPVVVSCAYGFRNNYMLHSVHFRPLVDLEKKNCARVPAGFDYFWVLKKPFKCLVKVVRVKLLTNHLQGIFRPSQQQWFNSRHSGNIIFLHNSCFLNQPMT